LRETGHQRGSDTEPAHPGSTGPGADGRRTPPRDRRVVPQRGGGLGGGPRGGHSFAFIKASEGVDLADPDFGANWTAAGEAGLVRGAYHFYVTEDDPEQQARLFIETVQLEPGDLAPVVDIELIGHGTPPGLPDRLRRFLELLEQRYGVRPIIYTSPKFWNTHFMGARYGVT